MRGAAPAPPAKHYDKLHGAALRNHVSVVCEAGRLTSDHIPDNTDLIVSAHSHWYVSDKAVEKARLGARGEIIREPQDPAFATWEPLFDATARLYRPELYQLPEPS